jgi:hypothetical protein
VIRDVDWIRAVCRDDVDLVIVVDSPSRVAVCKKAAVRGPTRIELLPLATGDNSQIGSIGIHRVDVFEVIKDDPTDKVVDANGLARFDCC